MYDESLLAEHPGTYINDDLQRGTLSCKKTAVPQTGKAVDGVWPSMLQGI
ncbi:MAG: hypothetical protein R2765_05760 [Ferruginibacter sp.]|nr:hypothetical protein [Ferruginibacter sp.]MCB0710417.1 hypothetical protein [Chitinophagaceae bacterium]MCC7378755.1 hypothetical protein [Chitinophagaceae bacterium]